MPDHEIEVVKFDVALPLRARGSKGVLSALEGTDLKRLSASLNTTLSHGKARETWAEYLMTSDHLEDSYGSILRICRELQVQDGCNGVLAQFASAKWRQTEEGESVLQAIDYKSRPFRSERRNTAVEPTDAIHPDNSDSQALTETSHAFDDSISKLISDPEALFNCHWRDFEQLLVKLYASQGFDVELQGGPKDHGVDARAVISVPASLPKRLAQRIRVAIQAKRYSKTNKLTEAEIRGFYGSLQADEYDRGVLVCTSSMTAAARAYLESRRVVMDRVLVLCGDDVLELLIAYGRAKGIPFWRTSHEPD